LKPPGIINGASTIFGVNMEGIQLFQGDCLEVMKGLPEASIDMVMCDLPYGMTDCVWDSVVPLNFLWEQYKHVTKQKGAQVFTSIQPFTTTLISSNLTEFKYCWVWDKVNKYTGTLNVNKRPLRRHEDICVFYSQQPTYNKQFRKGRAYKSSRIGGLGEVNDKRYLEQKHVYGNDGEHHNPCTILEIPADKKKELGLHPTQKVVELMEYLIRTYTNEGDTVLDNCMGSGTTGVACVNTGRKFVGIELDPKYFEIAKQRIEAALAAK